MSNASGDTSSIATVLAGLTPQQAEAASRSGAVLVLAGAGTGKTTAITAAVGHRIAVRGIPAQRILAATWVRGHRAHAEGSGAGNPL